MNQTLEKPFVGGGRVSRPATPTLRWWQRKSTRRVIQAIVVYALLIPGACLFILPLIWMLSTALKTTKEIFIFPPQWLPNVPQWGNFYEGWFTYLPFNTFLRNSLFITTTNIMGNLLSCCLAAYGFARLRARGRNVLFSLVLATMLLPNEVLIIPQYVMFTKLGWNNTWLPLTIPAWFGYPFFIFLLRQFFMTIPHDLDEAARLDGASSWTILARIILPLSKPALASVVIFGFIGNWNNFLAPLIYIRSPDKQVLAVGLNWFRGQYGNIDYHYMMAVALLVLLPVLVVFILGQRLFIQGIATSGLKG
jgi:multiple sugar transport system permease protein